MKNRLVLTALLVLVCAWPAPAQTPLPPSSPIVKSAYLWRQTFEIVWQTVRDKHFDPNFGGVNWDQVRARYEPRLAETKTDAELYRLLQQMLGELKQSHFNILPPELVLSEAGKGLSNGGIGIDLRIIAGEAVITRVEAGSTAARVGLRPGFIVKQIGEKTVAGIAALFARSDEPEPRKLLRLTRLLLAEIGGEPGSRVRIGFLDDQNQPHEATVTRVKLDGELSPRLGNFPPQYTEFEAERLPGNIGYIRFNIFTTPIIDKVRQAMRDFSAPGQPTGEIAGLIFDLRGNPGGVGGLATGIAGLLADKQGSLGTMKMRNNQLNFVFFPQANAYTGPVTILIDGLSGSTSEVFAGGMQEIGRAKVVGERSLGAALPSIFQKLPTGALFQFAIADFKTPNGILIEGRGVVPDIVVNWNRVSLLAGRDEQLETAVRQLRLIGKQTMK